MPPGPTVRPVARNVTFGPVDPHAGRDGIIHVAAPRVARTVRTRPPVILGTKFGCPVVPGRAIARPRLAELLGDEDWKVALVTGGAGTGKTVFAAQWFTALASGAREWVTLDADDNRPERFWPTLVLALERALPGAFAATAALSAEMHRLQPEFLDRLLDDWSAVEDPLTIALDDVHHLRSPQISEDLAFVIEHLPLNSRFLLISRVEPELPLSRWRARSWVAEVRQRDLALTLPETVSMISALGESRLSGSEIESLWHQTEGWAAGLRLAVSALKDRDDISVALTEFSGRSPVIADLLAEELVRRAPADLSEFLLRTSVADVLDADLCEALSGRSDSAEVLRSLEADLQFVVATGPDRKTYRCHPLLQEMLRSELAESRPQEAQELNRLAAAILEARGDLAGAAHCLLSAGDNERAFDVVFTAAGRLADVSDLPGIASLINLFPLELVTESAHRMLTYAFMLGLCGRASDALAWLERAAVRISLDPEPNPKDLATVDALRLLAFTVVAEKAEEIDAGCRAVEAVEGGLDLGFVGARARMNLVRGYLLVDNPREAASVLQAGQPGDELATLLLAPGLAARIALRNGSLSEAERHATIALETARAFGLENHNGTLDAHLALVGVLIDRDQLGDARVKLERAEEILQAKPEVRVYHVLFKLERARLAAALGDLAEVSAIMLEAEKFVQLFPRSALRNLVTSVATRWRLEAGETDEAESLIATMPAKSPVRALLQARLDLTRGRVAAVRAGLAEASFATLRDQVTAELILARAAIESGSNGDENLRLAIKLAAPEQLVRVVVEEGPVVARSARAAAEALGTESGFNLALALGSPPRTNPVRRPPGVVLSERELSVLRYLPTRLTNSEIASECFVSTNTVKAHLKSIYSKLGVSSRAEAATRARLLGLL